jgi:putative oxidoreductase
MVAAVLTVHLPKGLWNHNGGCEFNALIVATAFALAGVGPGDWSPDNVFDITWASSGWAIAAVVAGLIGGVVTVIGGRLVAARDDRDARAHPA